MGTLLCAGVVTAVTDAVVCARYGLRDAAVGHGVAGVLTVGLGGILVGGVDGEGRDYV